MNSPDNAIPILVAIDGSEPAQHFYPLTKRLPCPQFTR
jgi:hypothetical protein